MDVCECVWGMNSQNIYWRIESLHQRTLIRILYEFFKLNFGGKYFDVIISCWFGNLIAFIHISSFPFHGSFSYDFASQLISQKICFHINHNKSFWCLHEHFPYVNSCDFFVKMLCHKFHIWILLFLHEQPEHVFLTLFSLWNVFRICHIWKF